MNKVLFVQLCGKAYTHLIAVKQSVCLAEHEGAGQPDEASGQEDGSEWSMIDSDVDEHEELLR